MNRPILIKLLPLVLCLGLIAFGEAYGQYDLPSIKVRIRNIKFQKYEVFDSTAQGDDRFFASGLANSLHVNTKNYLISDELLFGEKEETTIALLDETERNLRSTDLFSYVRVKLDSVDEDTYDVRVITRDRWTTRPSLLFGSTSGKERYGARMEELNVLGSGTRFMAEGLYRNENNIGRQGTIELGQKRFLRSKLSLDLRLMANRYRTEQDVVLQKQYLSLSDEEAFGVRGRNYFGSDFIYYDVNDVRLSGFKDKDLSVWYSHAWLKKDRVYMSVVGELDDSYRGSMSNPLDSIRAFDNMGRVLLGFSSNSEDYHKVSKLNTYGDEDLAVGGYGMAELGRIFPVNNSNADNMYYIAGQGERSFYNDKYYLFGQLTGASAFSKLGGRFTYQEFLGLGFYRFNDNALIAARFREITVWNWYARRQLILDSDMGLRGFPQNYRAGDSRIIANIEFRCFPDWKWWALNFSGAAFYDGGTVWEQSMTLATAEWKNSVGIGIRVHDMKTTGSRGLFRVDVAWNATDGKFGGIIFTTNQLFSVFRNHPFRLPELFGLEFDRD